MNTEQVTSEQKAQTITDAWNLFEKGPMSVFPESFRPMFKLIFFCGALGDWRVTNNFTNFSQEEAMKMMQEHEDALTRETSIAKVAASLVPLHKVTK